jgi:outer membrane protein OmpA-like peptidoglycan-associated protein
MADASSFSDPFARRGAPTAKGFATRQDRYAGQGKGAARKADRFDKQKSPLIRPDAFALTAPAARAWPTDRFAKQAPLAKSAGLVAPPEVSQKAEPPAPAPTRRAPLHVVASLERAGPERPIAFLQGDPKRDVLARSRAGKTSSLVLVSGAGLQAMQAVDADVIEAPPPPVTHDIAPTPVAAAPAPAVRPGGGGGRGGGMGRGGPPRERGFNQDDFVGVMFGVAVLFLLLMWLLRGGAQPGQDNDNRLVGTQFAANQPINVTPAPPPPAPLPDPFGDQAVDLTPKGPIPEPAPETSNLAVASAAPSPAPTPAPAAAIPVADRKMHAWFCTAGSRLTVASRKALEQELGTFGEAFKGQELIVRGYADTRGTSEFNSALGATRANVVADYLRTQGLNVVDASGVGELVGLDDNQNCANQRRVDVFIKGGLGETPTRACAPEPDVEPLTCG